MAFVLEFVIVLIESKTAFLSASILLTVVSIGDCATNDFKAVRESAGVIAMVLFFLHAEYLKCNCFSLHLQIKYFLSHHED
jgi:hypothetical protein